MVSIKLYTHTGHFEKVYKYKPGILDDVIFYSESQSQSQDSIPYLAFKMNKKLHFLNILNIIKDNNHTNFT